MRCIHDSNIKKINYISTNIRLLRQFDDAYKSVSNFKNIKESKQKKPLIKNEIKTNLHVLKTNLKNSKALYAYYFCKYLKKKSASDLSWHIPLASQVIYADSEMVKTLEVEAYNFFMVSNLANSILYYHSSLSAKSIILIL